MPLGRYRWLRGHVRPIDALLPVLALLATTWLWGPLLWPPPPPPFAYGSEPFPVSPAVLHAGDTPDVEVTRCNRTDRDLTYVVSRVVQRAGDHEQWFLPTIGAVAPPGCAAIHSRAHTLPPELSPGTYRLFFTATFAAGDGGPTLVSTGRTVDFRVVATGDGGGG
jgi:hypothetical protein